MMTNRVVRTVPAFILVLLMGLWAPAEAQRGHQKSRHTAAKRAPAALALPCGNTVAFQVLLDRQGFSPGQIEATANVNTRRALTAFQSARHVAVSGKPDCVTWRALNGDEAEPAVVEYEITAEDAKGPFTARIPVRLEEQADLPALGYRSVLESLAERFHSAPALLSSMNRGGKFAAGQRIKVPAVTPFKADVKPERDTAAGEITIHVSREDSALRATRADGTVVLFAPVTSGSEHDPLPVGDWKVTGVAWRPVFHYNPELFWDANPKDQKATIKAGPNNPVGLVWIDLNLPHYGLHGTPEPGRIGVTQSHGCVRLTNWDVARVAALVKPGTPVLFR
jgi:lipoprotein-anchoring transpeptidase ErfK/SrfK